MTGRNLTDADVDSICDVLEQRIASRFLTGASKGVMSIVWKLIQVGVIWLAGYGFAHWTK